MSKRNYRRKKVADSDDEDDEEKNVSGLLQDRKELQKFRIRQHGVSAESLLESEDAKSNSNEDKGVDDPWKLKSGGGLTELKPKTGTQFGTSFSAETNKRDDDISLMKYIEEGLKKKRGIQEEDNEDHGPSKEDMLYQLPQHIDVKSTITKSEEMLSSQMLSGIPEVDLGIEAKIKNIEATEEAKMKMIDESKNRTQQASFVPTNMASNFMHHRRFYNEREAFEKEKKKEQKKKLEESTSAIVDKGPTVGKEIIESSVDTKYIEKAMHSGGGSSSKKKPKLDTTDDYMFEKFKKRSKDMGRKKVS